MYPYALRVGSDLVNVRLRLNQGEASEPVATHA